MMEKSLSRYYARKLWESYSKACLLPGIQVHHIDGNPFNNSIDNLVACTAEEHTEYHRKLGHYVQHNFIARADAYSNLTEAQKVEFRLKCSKAGIKAKGIKKSYERGPGVRVKVMVEMIDTKTGKIVVEFSSVSDAAEKLGIQRAHIRRVIKKERKAWHDYNFRYKTSR